MAIRLYQLNPLALVEETRSIIPNLHHPQMTSNKKEHIVMEQAHIIVQDVYKSVPQTTGGGGGGGGTSSAAHDDDDDT
jgi:hypothetical protein